MKLQSTETNFKSFPTLEEWSAVKEVSDKLKIFYQTTEYFSGSHYPTSCEYFAKVCDIKLELEAWVKSLNPLISSMASTMLSKFKKYWDDVHILMGVAAIFDPRYKMKLVEFNLERIYGEEASTKIQEVLTNCNDMFQEYKTRATSFDTSFSSEGNDVVEHDRLSSFDRYVALSRANVETRSELDLYLEESLIPRTPHFDNLSWWKTNGLKFPTLQRMSSSSSTTSSAALLGCESRKRAPSQLSDPIHVHHPGSSSNKRPASASAPSMAVKETPALALPPVPLFGLSIDAPLLIPCDADEEQFDKKIKLNPLSELSPPPNPCLQNECSSHINEESKTIISHVKSVKSVLVYQLTCGSTKTVEDMVKCANNAFFNLDMLETDYTSFYKDVKDFITYQDELLTIKRQREMQSFLELKTRYEDAITCANDLKYEIIRIQGHLEMTMKKKELLERLIAEAVELIGRLKQCVASLEEGEDALEHICKKQISIAAHENAQHEVQKLLTQVEAANDVLREIDQRENEALDGIESTTRRLKSIQS